MPDASRMSPSELRQEIMARVPWTGPGRAATLRTVERMPISLLRDTAEKLASNSALGTAHELRFLGELLGAEGGGYSCEPFPADATCDATLCLAGQRVDLEIAAHVAPAFSRSVARVCRRMQAWLENQSPHQAIELEIGNLWAEFPLTDRSHLDEDALFELLKQEAARKLPLIDDRDSSDSFELGEYITRCSRARTNKVWQTGYTMPSSSVEGQLARIVKQKLSPPQWRAHTPGILAIILHSHPVPGSIERYGIAETAFSMESTLAGIIEVPCVLDARPQFVERRPEPILSESEADTLRTTLDFPYQRDGDNWID